MELTSLITYLQYKYLSENMFFLRGSIKILLIILNIIFSLEYLSICNNFPFKLLAFKEILHGLLLSEYCARRFVSDSDSYLTCMALLLLDSGTHLEESHGLFPRDRRGRGRIFKDHLLQVQEWHILMNRKSIKGSRKPAGMNKELLTIEVEEGRDDSRNTDIFSACISRRTKVHPE